MPGDKPRGALTRIVLQWSLADLDVLVLLCGPYDQTCLIRVRSCVPARNYTLSVEATSRLRRTKVLIWMPEAIFHA